MARSIQLTYREAIVAAQRDAMHRDERVVVMGEDIGAAGSPFKTTEGLQAQFGRLRVRDTPISEQAFVGAAMGMALTGYRPIVELMFSDFMGVCYDQIVNEIAKHRFMQGGKLEVPLVIRAIGGGGARFGAQHSQTAEPWLLSVPGLKLWSAASPNDVYHMILAAVADPNPVVIFEHKALLGRNGPVEIDEQARAIDGPRLIREGRDVTVVGSLGMVERIVAAGDRLAEAGISAELFDIRVLRPISLSSIVDSVRKTNRLLVVEENHRCGGWGGEVVSVVTQEAFEYLDAPPARLTLPDWPMPYSPGLEDAAIPSVQRIIEAATGLVRGGA